MTIESLYDLDEVVASAAEDLILQSEKVTDLSTLGLDQRASYGGVWIDLRNEEFVAVTKNADRSLQYYGGFEYIDKEYRKEYGDYVFYMNEQNGDGRVASCFERLRMSKMTSEERAVYEDKLDQEEQERHNR